MASHIRDGSLTGNPAFSPLLIKKPDCDLIIVRVDPVNRPEAPRSVRDIFSRTVEYNAFYDFARQMECRELTRTHRPL